MFDLDGTLVESAPDLLNALNHVVEPLGLEPVTLPSIRTMIGQGAKAMILAALEKNGRDPLSVDLEALWSSFLAHYRENIAVDSYVFDGVETALAALRQEGARLAVCTNKTQALSDQLLVALGLDDFFDSVVGSDSVPAKKPDGGHIIQTVREAGGSADRAVMVGDSRTDEKAALNAGLPFIFVPFGYEVAPVDQITKVSVVHHYSELVDCVRAAVS